MNKKNPTPVNEDARIAALYNYNILDTLPEKGLDAITKLASYIAETPIALISLIDKDRQWFKSKVGLDAEQTSRDISFCQYAIMDETLFEVEDATKAELFSDNPLVTGDLGIRFYAGVPLTNPSGFNIGTLCVIDKKPKKLTDEQREALETLATQVIAYLELQLKNEKLGKAQRELSNFFDLSLDLVCIANVDGFFKKVSPAFTKVLGYTPEELMGRPFTDFIHPDDVDSTFDEVIKLSKGALTINFENRYRTKNGDYISFSWAVAPDTTTGHLYAIARDVTDQKKMIKTLETKNKELDKAQIELSKFFDLSLDLVCIANTDGFFKRISPAFSRVLGYTEEELVGQPFTNFIHPEDLQATFKEIEKLSQGALTINFENRYRAKNGDYIWFSWSSAPDTTTGQLYAMARNVSDTKMFIKEIEKKNKELDQFAYIVSHDLKAPLRGIASLTEFLKEDLGDDLPENPRKLLDMICERAGRMQTLINDILEYSKIGRKKIGKEKVDLNALIATVVEELRTPKGLIVEVEPNLPMLNIQRIFMFQIFLNLISNAVKYHDKFDGTGFVKIGVKEEEKDFEFFVQDNGSGIEPAYHKKIFDVFQTIDGAKTAESTGIGLSIIQKIIEELNGSVRVESELGKGSCFYISLSKKYLHRESALQ